MCWPMLPVEGPRRSEVQGQAAPELSVEALDEVAQEGNRVPGVMHVAGPVSETQNVAGLGHGASSG